MRVGLFQWSGVVGLLTVCGVAGAESHLMRYADVHGDKVVFTYEGDLWLGSTEGGEARRITNDPGSEVFAKFSPDGSQLAFTAQYDGGTDVYVMDARGGVPKRLTFHPASDEVLDWFPDGQSVLFRSRREYPSRADMIYKVAVSGGMPEKLPVDRAGLTALSPDGKRIAYNRISRERRHWKRYCGGEAQDIWLGDLEKREFTKLTDWIGTDNFPMWRGDAIYFTSDREHGTLNIYRQDLDTGKVTGLTDYTGYDVKWPSLGGDQIVYQYGESLHLLDLTTGKTRRVPVEVPSDRVRMRPESVEVAPKKGAFRLSPSGKRLLLEARGEILSLPVEDGEPVNLTRGPGTREKCGVWSPDGKWVAFISDKSGEEEVYLADPRGEQPWRQLTKGGPGFRMQPVWSPDSKHLLFSDKFMRLNLVGVESDELTVIDTGKYDDAWSRWGIQDYVWSPDSRWVAYTKMERSMTESIFLYSIEGKTVHRLTSEMTQDWGPSFDPKGRYLYFLSNRTYAPIMGRVDQNHVFLDMCRPYLMILESGEPSPFEPKDSQEASKSEDQDEEAKPDEDDVEKCDDVDIDLDGIERRIVVAEGVPAGNYFRLEATDDGFLYLAKPKHEFLKYQTVDDETGGKLDLYGYDLEEEEAKKLLGGIANYHLSADGEKLAYRAGSKYGVVDAGKEAEVGDGDVDLGNVRVKVDRDREFAQIFNEAWRIHRDWFYDVGMHGVDWAAIGEKYRKFVPYCGNRSDLNYLIGEMIAELNAGHTYVRGGDILHDEKKVATGLLGVRFEADPTAQRYRITHIVPGTPGDPKERSPLDVPGCPIRVGHYLIAIDGEEVTTHDNVFAFLQHKADRVVTLTCNDKPLAEGATRYRVKTLGSERAILYREWVNRNRAFVEKATDGQVGYLHITDMGQGGLIEFAKAFYPQHYKKGFILDDRYNPGGFVTDMLIDRLERRLWGITVPREGKPLPEPERVFHGHYVVLINEFTGSSGEFFAEGVKRKTLAPLVGMRTWGGAIGYETHQDLVDGGGTTTAQFPRYGLDGTWLIEGHGVVPDIEVPNLPNDVVRGRDAQLETAVKHLLDKLAEDPKDIPAAPARPDKSKKRPDAA